MIQGKQLEEKVSEHYAGLLGVKQPWQVAEVRREPEQERVVVRIAWSAGHAPLCPECGQPGIWHDSRERQWRHLDAMGHEVRLHCAVPRCRCREHGVRNVAVPWPDAQSRFTLHFEAFAVSVMLATSTLSQASALLGLHWESTQLLIDRAVARGLARRSTQGLRRVGLDETPDIQFTMVAGAVWLLACCAFFPSRPCLVLHGSWWMSGKQKCATS